MFSQCYARHYDDDDNDVDGDDNDGNDDNDDDAILAGTVYAHRVRRAAYVTMLRPTL